MSSLQTWQKFLAHSLATRLEPEAFESYIQILSAKHPLPPSRISDLFLRPTEDNTVCLDPRIPRYLQVLLAHQLVTLPGVLNSLWKVSSYRPLPSEGNDGIDGKEGDSSAEKKHAKDDGKRWTNSYTSEETLFYRLTKYISSGTAPKDVQEAVELVIVCIQWMETVVAAGNAAHEMLGLGHTEEMAAQNMALGTLIVAVVENSLVQRSVEKGSVPKTVRKQLSKTLASFEPLLQNSPLSAARIAVFRTQTLVQIEPVDKKERAADKEIEDILDEATGLESMVVVDLPVMNSRAGLYIYLNSLVSTLCCTKKTILTEDQLVARPLLDDHAIFAYLHNRYQVSYPSYLGSRENLTTTGRYPINNSRSCSRCF
jgi:mediator of RNA polymerase II transcription subunit 5